MGANSWAILTTGRVFVPHVQQRKPTWNVQQSKILDKNLKQNKVDAHDLLVHVINAIKHLSRQGHALRGTYDKESKVCKPDSNIWQLLCSYSSLSYRLKDLLSRNITYTSPEVQNELLD